jgi:asparagine synthetase B (glutamine-hydrolysing)
MTPYRLSPLEIASGLVLGSAAERGALPDLPGGTTLRSALEDAVRPALERPPCLVSFSGGRDSSTVLAVAANLARREGLAMPVPVTNRFPLSARAEEREWQERVLAHLRLDDWVRIASVDELDCVGPVAVGVLRRHGLLWPFNVHFHVPLLRAAAGGSLLTGIGGDEALSESSWARALAVLSGRALPRPRDALRLGLALAPPVVRRPMMRRRIPRLWTWLTPAAEDALRETLAAEAAAEPLRWTSRFRRLHRFRSLSVGTASLALLAADVGVEIVHPFHEPGFIAALAGLPPGKRFATRDEAMRVLAGDLLPADVLLRRTKASFDDVFWGGHSRALLAHWHGDAVDRAVVDPERLRETWSSARPDARCFTLLQSVWLALDAGEGESVGHELEQALAGRR